LSLEQELLEQRIRRIAEIQALGFRPYGSRFDFTHSIPRVLADYGPKTAEELASRVPVRICGRIQALRRMGKAGFLHLLQNGERLQIYVKKDALPENDFALYQLLDIGDIIGAEGYLFRTRTGELSVHVERLHYLAKTLLSMPEKWHGLEDVELRYRQRYLDLIANPEVRKIFVTRGKIVSSFRRQLEARDFIEVETPMMQPLYGGAAARPFITHHNTLDLDLYLRIAPELYLKRLITGGLERVFEINRNFRNEGISTFHNPEFTMMEFYQAYATYEDLMPMTEELITFVSRNLSGTLAFHYQGNEIDLTPPWRRITVRNALTEIGGVDPAILTDREQMTNHAQKLGIEIKDSDPPGKVMMAIFDETVEAKLIQPTFVTHYPVEVSPLSRRNAIDPSLVDRFELYICGKEIANAFSELNDPVDQRGRFEMQLKEREAGDLEAHEMDEDFISALECGMPPTAGEGIGIDRLVMLFTNSASIRDVILFPLLRTRETSHGESATIKTVETDQ
jgi:lysyl-tRNA synthetase class 2